MIRRFLHNRLLVTVAAIAAALLLFTVLAAFSAGRTGPVANVVNALADPVRKAVTGVGDFFGDLSSAMHDNADLRAENEDLRAEVASLQDQLRESEQFAAENELLRAQLGVVRTEWDATYAMGDVIGRSSLQWSRTVSVNLGTESGVSVYDPVVTPEGLVGFVSSVSLTSCQVTTVIDSGMSCSCILSTCRETGVAEGSFDLMGSGKLKITMLPKDAAISVGEVAETSGLGGIFPAGISIGTCISSDLADDGLSRTVILEPTVDISRLRTVFIITDFTVQSDR